MLSTYTIQCMYKKNSMKKSTVLAGIFFLSLILLNACSKKEQLSPVNDPPEQNIPAPLSAPLFDELNETIARFDPLYLQVVYKDKRSKAEINEEAARLLTAINQNPTSILVQKELTELYHFNNFADLQKASNVISNNSGELKRTFLGKDTVLSKAKMNQLNEARKAFVKNKIIPSEIDNYFRSTTESTSQSLATEDPLAVDSACWMKADTGIAKSFSSWLRRGWQSPPRPLSSRENGFRRENP